MADIVFSIITVSRNASAHIGRCLSSVAGQDYPNFEHLIIDSASTDGTQAIAERYAAAGKTILRSEPDAGIYDAMNKGIAQARGDYVLFLGADDYLADSRVLSEVATCLDRAGHPDVIYGAIEVRAVDGTRTVFRPPPPAEALDFMICGCLPHQATFAHRRVFDSVGRFDLRYQVHADYDWFLRVLAAADDLRIERVDRVISSFALGGASSGLERGQHEVFAIQNAFPLYRQPEWLERRLQAFQSETLRYRLLSEGARQGASPAAAPDAALVPTAGDSDPLPIHFFTIVLNGEPFIRYHIDMMRALPFDWHWHIVEGVADLVHDTAWSVAGGGRIDASLHDNGRSNDGTSAYLDALAAAYPDRVTIYRKPPGVFWDGKKEMVAAPLASVRERCLLWQVDADELWTQAQVEAVRSAFAAEPQRTAAFFWCDYFVGPRALISTRYNYAQNPKQDWLRVWRYQPGDAWGAHEPPILLRRFGSSSRNLADIAPFHHDEMEAIGAVFQHFAYVTPEQLRFKEVYYGYQDALRQWQVLQGAVARNSVLLRDYFAWVTDETMADSAERLGVEPIATQDDAGQWSFKSAPMRQSAGAASIVIDGVFFQHNRTSGIARVWRNLLQHWRDTDLAGDIVVLDRAGSAPRLPGLRYHSLPVWDEAQTGADSLRLQQICDNYGAALFVSSYYTTPIETPSLFLAHDMIPERLHATKDEPIWREKDHAIAHAAAFVCVSEATKQDVCALHPNIDPASVAVIANGVEATFAPASSAAIEAFRAKHRLSKPYLLMVGERLGVAGYKNGPLLFRALQTWARRDEFDLVCVGGAANIEPILRASAPSANVRRLDLTDAELIAAYSGAATLAYPSRFEGFGLPILEAMACGCPVVALEASAMAEVGGQAAVYFSAETETALQAALDRATAPGARAALAQSGMARAKDFDWSASAAKYADLLTELVGRARVGALAPSPLWRRFREEQRANQNAARAALAGARTMPHQFGAGVPFRESLFAVRSVLLRTLPHWAMPSARRVWRRVMGIPV